ncbi:hypothetical protein YC2023_023604 [Brassica napus]
MTKKSCLRMEFDGRLRLLRISNQNIVYRFERDNMINLSLKEAQAKTLAL